MSPSTRRRFLLASGGLAGLAGCTSVLSKSTLEEIVLGRVDLSNYADEPKVFDLLVEIDGEVVHWDSHEVSEPPPTFQFRGRESVMVEMDGPGAVVLRARVGDHRAHVDFTESPYAEELAGECVLGEFSYDLDDEDVPDYDASSDGKLHAHPRSQSPSNCPALAGDE